MADQKMERYGEVRALMLPQDGKKPCPQFIGTFSRSEQKPNLRIPPILRSIGRQSRLRKEAQWKNKFFFRVKYNPNEAGPIEFDNHPLPNIQPGRPEQWDDEAWKYRCVIGNRHYHGFFTRAENKAIGMILKVAGNIERNAIWTYEDIDRGETVQKEHLKEFEELMNEFVKRYPDPRDTLSYQA